MSKRKTMPGQKAAEALLQHDRCPVPPALQVVAIRYADGREVTVDAVGDDALLAELRAYVRLREVDAVFPGMSPHGLRDLAQELDATHREQVSDRNRRPDPRKDVSKEDLLAYREQFEYDHGKLRGWKKAACRTYGISLDTLNARLK